MSSYLERQLREIEERLGLNRPQGDWCPTCVNEQAPQVIIGDAPEKRCPDCGRVLGPLGQTRVIRVVLDDDDVESTP